MRLRWTARSLSDLARLDEFLQQVNPQAAAEAMQSLVEAPERLLTYPRVGERVERYGNREVRRLLVVRYEIHYEILDELTAILRVWHTREHR